MPRTAARLALTLCMGLAVPGCVGANVETSPRPESRPADLNTATRAPEGQQDFAVWLRGFENRARSAGVTEATLARARPSLRYLPSSIRLDRAQSEFGARPWEYLDSQVTPARVQQGQAQMRRNADLLARIEARFGVPPQIVVAIWGVETSYGANRGNTSTLATLATLARDGRRAAFFEGQLIDALKIVQAGEIAPDAMIGSWAGAMGHTQFMPSSFLAHAVDFTGNGRRDLWGENPADALASAANYLARAGWTRGQPWAVEVRLPTGFDLNLTGSTRSASAWSSAGLVAVRGSTIAPGEARLLLPGGARGPAFLAYRNYDVLKEYNISDAYVLALGHLSDRLAGGGPIAGQWPRNDRPLTVAERVELQRRLNALGYDTGGIDGRLGPMSVAAVQAWQRANGLPADGYVSADLLARLRR